MTRSGIIFIIVLILNALLAFVYLLWYLIFKKDKDNRKQYVMHTMIMLLCPIVGILYFFAIISACVPFPVPGAPNIIIFMLVTIQNYSRKPL